MEHTFDPVWIILSVLAGASVLTLLSTWLNNRALSKYRSSQERIQANYQSCQILSDMMETTREFRTAIDHLLDGDVTMEDHDDLVRVMTYMTELDLFRQDRLVKDKHVAIIYGPILKKLTNKKMEEILGYASGTLDRDPGLYSGLRKMRRELTGL